MSQSVIPVGIKIIQAEIDEGVKGSIRSTVQSQERFGYKRVYTRKFLHKIDVYREILFPRRSIVDTEYSRFQTIRYIP